MVHGSWCSTFDGVGALLFDVLPITIGASPLGQCHNLPPMTKMFLCGGACLYTAVTSSKIAREGLPSNGTSALPQRTNTIAFAVAFPIKPEIHRLDFAINGIEPPVAQTASDK